MAARGSKMVVGAVVMTAAALALAKGPRTNAVDEFVGHPTYCGVMLASDDGSSENDGADYFYGRALSAAVDGYVKANKVSMVDAIDALKSKCKDKGAVKKAAPKG